MISLLNFDRINTVKSDIEYFKDNRRLVENSDVVLIAVKFQSIFFVFDDFQFYRIPTKRIIINTVNCIENFNLLK